jgi:hypothetical protein
MTPRFMHTLYFDCDGNLEVCGPTNFSPSEEELVINVLRIKQNGQIVELPDPITVKPPEPEWESRIPGAKGPIGNGHATGFASGYIVKNGKKVPVSWVGELTLADECAIRLDLAPPDAA